MRNVVINDWWDRGPCTWICDIDKLDENNEVQFTYKKLIEMALSSCDITKEDSPVPNWYFCGDAYIEDIQGVDWSGGPKEVEHAKVHPPCDIVGIVILWYDM